MTGNASAGEPEAAADAGEWAPVPPPPETRFAPDAFWERELYLDVPYFLKHFHRLANAVIESGPDRGFIDLHVWRANFARYNFRAQENHAAFAYFYAADAPWNPYRGSGAVRERLEAILEWLNERSNRGEYWEWRWRENVGAATLSFGVCKLMRTLELLREGPPIDAAVYEATREMARRMIFELFDDAMFARGARLANQLEGIWYAAGKYIALFGDAAMRDAMREKLEGGNQFQSPAGFFYEAGSTEWGYNLKTHRMVLNFVASIADEHPEVGEHVRRKELLFWDWVAHNVAADPSGERFFLNGGLQSRHLDTSAFGDLGEIQAAAESEAARAFPETAESCRAKAERWRERLARLGSAAVAPLPVGGSDAYAFPVYGLFARPGLPAAEEREAARKALPWRRDAPFVEQRVDPGCFDPPFVVTFVRRGGYYAVFNSGSLNQPWQRLGMGLLAHRRMGAVSQNANGLTKDVAALPGRPSWGVARTAMTAPLEGGRVEAAFSVDGVAVDLREGVRELPEGALRAVYSLEDEGRAEWVFDEAEIRGRISLGGEFVHQLPLLVGEGDRFAIRDKEVVLGRGNGRMTVEWAPASAAWWVPYEGCGEGVTRGFLIVPAREEVRISLRFAD